MKKFGKDYLYEKNLFYFEFWQIEYFTSVIRILFLLISVNRFFIIIESTINFIDFLFIS